MRILHVIGLVVSVATTVLVALQSSVSTNTKVGVAIGVGVALLTALGKALGKVEGDESKPRILHVIGLVVSVATPVLVALQSSVSTNTKVGVAIGVGAALLTALGEALGKVEEDEAKPRVPPAAVVLLLVGALSLCACKTTPNKPDSFYGAVVTCTQSNSYNQQASAAVLSCLSSAVAGNYAVCLHGLVAGGMWTVDEVACLVRKYATESATRLNNGTPQPADQSVLNNANEWIRSHEVVYR